MKHFNVVCAVIVYNGRILCVQRPYKGFASTAGKWEFPGGKIEDGESAEVALVREIREELDYEVKVEQHLVTVEHVYPDFSLTMQAFLCTAESDEFNRKEHINHGWLLTEELPTLDWAEADVKILGCLASFPEKIDYENIAKNL